MYAGVCGKRLGFEEVCGGSSPPGSSAKKLRFSGFNSSDFAFGFEEQVSFLLRMFSSMDRQVNTILELNRYCEKATLLKYSAIASIYMHHIGHVMAAENSWTGCVVSFSCWTCGDSLMISHLPCGLSHLVETVLKSRNHKIDDAIESLHALCLGDDLVKNEVASLNLVDNPNGHAGLAGENMHQSKQSVDLQNDESNFASRISTSGLAWVDTFVQEMMNASNLGDARARATRTLEAFESSIITHSRVTEAQEIASLKEQVQSLLRDNQILKRAVTIQHERNLEQEEKVREVQQLKLAISQYQEKVRTLELNNYSLKLHLQRAQWANSIPGHFQPDVI